LKHYGFKYKSFGSKNKSTIGKFWGLFKFGIKEFIAGFKFKPDIFLSHGSIYAAHAAFIQRKPHISFEDTGNWEQVRLYLPFTKCILTSDIFPQNYGFKQIRLNSHNEIAYLGSKYFNPNPSFKNTMGLGKIDKYALIRFVAWNATHDRGQKGLSEKVKFQIVDQLLNTHIVFISSENNLPDELERYKVTFDPHEIHNALYYANVFIGEGTTMAMEAAILGTPSVYINTLQYSNVKDMEKYGLLFNYDYKSNILEEVEKLISQEDLKDRLKTNKLKMLSEKIDLTAFLVWFIENWPDSFRIMKENPDYQYRFK